MVSEKTYEALKKNAKDCLFYGYGRTSWNTYGITDKDLLNKVWNEARKELENDF